MSKRTAFAVFCYFVVASIFWGCSEKKEIITVSSAETSDELVIGLSIDTLALERWIRDCDVFLNTAKEFGAHVIVQNAGNDIEEQRRQIQYLIDKKVAALVILAKKADSLTDVIAIARSKNISVISYDRLILNADVNLYVSVDSRQVGVLMAEGLADLKPQGKYFCIYGPQDDYNMTLIDAGVRQVLNRKNIPIELVFYTDSWNYDVSYLAMKEFLDNGNIPDAIICGNDAVAGSVIRALSEYPVPLNIPVSGQDAEIAACQNIVQGTQALTVYKPITELAKLTAQYACELARGKTIADLHGISGTIYNGFDEIPVVWLPPKTVTKKNIDSVVIKSGFHTYGEIYRNSVKK